MYHRPVHQRSSSSINIDSNKGSHANTDDNQLRIAESLQNLADIKEAFADDDEDSDAHSDSNEMPISGESQERANVNDVLPNDDKDFDANGEVSTS